MQRDFISASIRGRSSLIACQTNRSRLAKFCDREAHQCGPDCILSMATAQFGPLVWLENSQPQFTVRSIRRWEVICSITTLVRVVNWLLFAWVGLFSPEQ